MKRMLLLSHMVLVSGCMTIETSDRRYVMCETEQQFTCHVLDVLEVFPSLTSQSDHYTLQFYAKGDFLTREYATVVRQDKDVDVLTFGLWPGVRTFLERPGNSISPVMTCILVPIGSLGVNGVLLGIPTINALLIEPFQDYRQTPGNEAFAVDWSIVGCRKHKINTGKGDYPEERRDKGVKSVTRMQLDDFSVVVNGQKYAIVNGCTTIQSLRKGQPVRIKIETAPTTVVKSSDRLTDVVGVDYELTSP